MKTAVMFSGQGAQVAGMGKELYDTFPVCKDIFEQANQALGFSISDICFGDDPRLHQTEYTQPAILTTSIAAYQLVKHTPIDYLLGLSLGEYSALVASGALEFTQTVELVRKRGRFMTEACPEGVGAMSAVLNLPRALVEEACQEASAFGIVSAANYNTANQIVIAGETEAVAQAEILALAKGAKRCMRLKVSGAFHTALLAPASVQLSEELATCTVNDMKTPVVSNLTGQLIPTKADIAPTLVQQVMSPVRWEDSIMTLLALGVDTFVEVGVGKTLCGFVKKIADGEVKTYHVEDCKSLETFLKSV